MTTRIVFGSIVMMFVLTIPASAGERVDLKQYFSDTANKVKATNNPSEKRQILNKSIQTMSKALNMVQGSSLVSKGDGAAIERFKTTLQEKQDELAGNNGYVRVSDDQLNAFSDYVVQDSEQAVVEVISISLVAALLILILVVLIAR